MKTMIVRRNKKALNALKMLNIVVYVLAAIVSRITIFVLNHLTITTSEIFEVILSNFLYLNNMINVFVYY